MKSQGVLMNPQTITTQNRQMMMEVVSMTKIQTILVKILPRVVMLVAI